MPDLNFLDSKHAIYATHEAAWKREEKRLQGGDAILDELIQFAHEDSGSYEARKKWARWIGFGRTHTSILSGHLRRAAPLPNYAELGEVRSRQEVTGEPSLAELFHYNCDGVGNDGSQLPAFIDGVEQRALATGFRWLMMELPTLPTLQAVRVRLGKAAAGSPPPDVMPASIPEDEVRAGFRPYLVEYSPLSVTNWRVREGVLQWAIVRIPVEPLKDFDQQATAGLGYYFLVRQGYTGLGEDFRNGGWWKYDAQKAATSRGTWDDTSGQIPMWQHIGEPGSGTYERPSLGQSSTMELGQLSADLMNAVSEQRFNLRQAAKSISYGLGVTKAVHDAIISQLGDGSVFVAVPPAMGPTGEPVIPTIWNSSAAALDADAYRTVIEGAVSQAKEIMVREITAGLDASGVSRDAAFAEATSPLLARIAATAEQSLNTLLYFVARRFGVQNPTASTALPREYELRNVLDSIDQMLDSLQKAGPSSTTWEKSLLMAKGDEMDLLPDDEKERQSVEDELGNIGKDKATLDRSLLQAQVVKAWLDAGATEDGAAEEAGVDESRLAKLFGAKPPEPAVVGNITPGQPAPQVPPSPTAVPQPPAPVTQVA